MKIKIIRKFLKNTSIYTNNFYLNFTNKIELCKAINFKYFKDFLLVKLKIKSS
jgi:hypothetical protein